MVFQANASALLVCVTACSTGMGSCVRLTSSNPKAPSGPANPNWRSLLVPAAWTTNRMFVQPEVDHIGLAEQRAAIPGQQEFVGERSIHCIPDPAPKPKGKQVGLTRQRLRG